MKGFGKSCLLCLCAISILVGTLFISSSVVPPTTQAAEVIKVDDKAEPATVDVTTFRGRMAVRLAARVKLRSGELSREDYKKICKGLRDNDVAEAVSEEIGFAMACDGVQPKSFQDILQWLLDNWQRILEIIMSIIALL